MNGLKTYAIAVCVALGAVGAFLQDQISGKELVEALFAAAGLAGLRHGVATEIKKLEG